MHGESLTLGKRLKSVVKKESFSLVVALIILVIVLSCLSPYFFTVKNIMTVGLYAAIIGIMAFGLTIGLLMGIFDLSQYAVATLAGVAMVYLLTAGVPSWLCLIAALAVGVLCGLFNSFIIIIFKVIPIIATMSSMYIFRGICYIITNTQDKSFVDPLLNYIGRGYISVMPISVMVLLIVFAVTAFILKFTIFGRNIYAVGANANASYISGINVKKTRTWAIVLSSVYASLAGIVMTCQMGAIIASSGVGAEMEICTAVFLGGLSLTGGKGKVSGTFLGLLILTLINNGLTLLSVQSFYQMLVRGVVLIAALSIDSARGGGYK